jgi:polysaccharide pyruvyl transferase CsaB
MNKIAIHGYYGYGNLGDEAILGVLLKELRRFPGIRAVVFSGSPVQVSEMHRVKSVRAQGRRNLIRRIWETKTSKLVILGGGGLLKDYGANSANMQKWLSLLQLAQKLKVKNALYAVGAENISYEHSKKLLKDVLNKVDFLSVRDAYSKQVLENAGVAHKIEVTADPAVLLSDTVTARLKDIENPPRVIVCVRHWFDKGFSIENPEADANFIRCLGEACDFLIERHKAEVDFFPFRTMPYDDDRLVAEKVASSMKRKDSIRIHSRAPDPDEFMAAARQSSLIIGMRLHSLIMGAAAGIPVIGLEYMPKVRAFMDSIKQGPYCLDLRKITVDRLIGSIRETFDTYAQRSEVIVHEMERLKKAAKKNVDDLMTLVPKR